MARKAEMPELEDEMRQKEEEESSLALAAPTMDDLPVRSYHPGRLLTFFANAQPAGVTYMRVSGPGTVDPNSGLFSWMPPLTQTGAQTVVIRATNAAGSDQKSTTLNRANQPPVLDFIPDRTAHPGRQLSFYCNAMDADGGDTISYSVSSGVGTFNNPQTPLFTWTPPQNQTSAVQVTVRATDGPGDFVEQQFTINMSNQPPFIDFLPDRNATVGNLLTFHVNAFDPDNDPLMFTFVGSFPAGASVVGGVFSWTPFNGQQGTYTFTVQATDPSGATYQRQFTVIVS